MSIARKIGNLGTALDSAALSTFLSKGTTDGEFDTIAWGDVTGKPSYIDSALATQLFDSAYVQLRQSAVSSGGLDSAAVTTLIDSSYVANRAGTGSSGFIMYNYNATSGQTAFQDSDTAGNVLSYTADGILVYYNGLLLADEDYTATDGSAVTLTEGADSGAQITIGKWNLTGAGSSGSSAVWYGDRALAAGGDTDAFTRTNVIDYWDMTTTANASDFGDLSNDINQQGSTSDASRGLFGGGYITTIEQTNIIEYVTIATPSNATDFGDLTIARNALMAVGDGTYGVFAGGYSTARDDTMDYVTVATPANASDFGNLTSEKISLSSISNTTYGLFAGGRSDSVTYLNVIEYITVATPSNATDFGDLLSGKRQMGNGGADDTRGILAGGTSGSAVNTIEYVTIATPGNATDFGDLLASKMSVSCTSNGTYVHICGGSTYTNSIEQITVQTPANSTDFGDLTVARDDHTGISGAAS